MSKYLSMPVLPISFFTYYYSCTAVVQTIHLHAITLPLATLALLARLASTTSPAFTFDPQTNRTASRLSQQPLFVPSNSPVHAADTRFATTARFPCTKTHDRQEISTRVSLTAVAT
jgi:hypothetical protein